MSVCLGGGWTALGMEPGPCQDLCGPFLHKNVSKIIADDCLAVKITILIYILKHFLSPKSSNFSPFDLKEIKVCL